MPEDRSVLERAARDPDRSWAYGPGPDEVADLYLPAADQPLRGPVLLVHGGFWRPDYDRTHLRPMAQALADRGHPVVLVEYARTPGDPDATVSDVVAAVEALAALPQPFHATPVVVGHSAGGHLALLAAHARPGLLRGCLALAPVADVVAAEALALDGDAVAAFLGAPAVERPDLDPARLSPPTIPTTLLHGEEDTLVPVALSESYARPGTRLVRMPGIGHFEPIDPVSAAWSAVIDELDALAVRPGGQ